jgi:UDP-N-acetylmuramate: L-alanyl-gamma-D-glutamyl-meso-diaminopimelate ligase
MLGHLYFLGIGGTLMGSLALLARDMGFEVSGSDGEIYPPMSDLLAAADVTIHEGFSPKQLDPAPDLVIVGNANLPRGNDAIEYVLNAGLPYTSGAQWLGDTVLQDRWVIAVAGTHGKTTTASMIAWILEHAGLTPGYLIGGAPANFSASARLGETPFFVVEADEYDTSYFDRRSKFVHYRPRTVILNNLEYDHADIFPDLAAIQNQFHLLMRTIPNQGLVIAPSDSEAIGEVLNDGCWTPISRVGQRAGKRSHAQDNGERWSFSAKKGAHDRFTVLLNDEAQGEVHWSLFGEHNKANALNAIAAARHAGVPTTVAIDALSSFQGVKRRMEVIYQDQDIVVYDDFAHHPTAIRTTLQGLRAQNSQDEIVAIIEPRTHTMSLGSLRSELKTCCAAADRVIWFRGENIKWDLHEIAEQCVVPAQIVDNVDKLVTQLAGEGPDTGNRRRHLVIMSNGAFGGIYQQLADALNERH